MERMYLHIYGIVQGVFYRSSASSMGSSLGLTGWVRNCSDGSVEIVADGERSKLDAFLRWCRKGPEDARIDNIKVEYTTLKSESSEFNKFSIVH